MGERHPGGRDTSTQLDHLLIFRMIIFPVNFVAGADNSGLQQKRRLEIKIRMVGCAITPTSVEELGLATEQCSTKMEVKYICQNIFNFPYPSL